MKEPKICQNKNKPKIKNHVINTLKNILSKPELFKILLYGQVIFYFLFIYNQSLNPYFELINIPLIY